jgi:hypothetical protein
MVMKLHQDETVFLSGFLTLTFTIPAVKEDLLLTEP